MTRVSSHNSGLTPLCLLHTEKIAEAVLPYVFKKAFPLSLLKLAALSLSADWNGWRLNFGNGRVASQGLSPHPCCAALTFANVVSNLLEFLCIVIYLL